MKPDFNDTSIAYGKEKYSNIELVKRIILFKLLNNKFTYNLGLKSISAISHFPFLVFILNPFYKIFCGGKNLDDLNDVINRFSKSNIKVVPDFCKEGSKKNKHFKDALNEVINALKFSVTNNSVSHCVFKISALESNKILISLSRKCENLSRGNLIKEEDYIKLYSRVDGICNFAYMSDIRIMIDAEESWIQPIINFLANEMMIKYNKANAIVINTYQMYLKNGLETLKDSYELSTLKNYFLGVKLVRGAYHEKENDKAMKLKYDSPILESYDQTNIQFDTATKFCLSNLSKIHVFIGTHNESSILKALDYLRGVDKTLISENVYFAQLYGMGDVLTYNISMAGINAAKYIPYGKIKECIPYLLRRAQENSSINGIVNRELQFLTSEYHSR